MGKRIVRPTGGACVEAGIAPRQKKAPPGVQAEVGQEELLTEGYDMTNLVGSLAESWGRKAASAAADLRFAASAPALFKPEFVERRIADLNNAVAWQRYWLGQATR